LKLVKPSSVTFRFFRLGKINRKGYPGKDSRFEPDLFADFTSELNFSSEKESAIALSGSLRKIELIILSGE
jgi:hypothetical protein